MNPLLSFLLAEIVKQAPALAIELVRILSRSAVTDEDWERLQSRYAGRTYQDYLDEAANKPSVSSDPAASGASLR